MRKLQIQLKTIDDVKDFVNIVSKCPYEVDLSSGRYVVDAKSIMGIFSLDLSKPINVEIFSDDCDDFLTDIEKFVVAE